MNISIDRNDVVASGTCVLIGNQTLKFEFNKNFMIKISFVDDDSKSQKIESEVVGGALCIRLRNFNNSLGTANVESLRLGIMQGRPISLNFAAYRIGDDKGYSRVFSYTFFYVNEEHEHE